MAMFIILVGLTITRFSWKMLISTRCIHDFISSWIKKSWTDSILLSNLTIVKLSACLFVCSFSKGYLIEFQDLCYLEIISKADTELWTCPFFTFGIELNIPILLWFWDEKTCVYEIGWSLTKKRTPLHLLCLKNVLDKIYLIFIVA